MTRTASLKSKVLLVEGDSDKHVIWHIRAKNPSLPEFCIEPKGRLHTVLSGISPEIKVHGREVVGIMVDADDHLQNRWDEVAVELSKANIVVPSQPLSKGTIIPGNRNLPRVGVWLMPDNLQAGELEDFIRTMVPSRDSVWPKSENYVDSIPSRDRKFAPGKIKRAQLYAWLATREQPFLMGAAIGAGDLHLQGSLSSSFIAWLYELFA